MSLITLPCCELASVDEPTGRDRSPHLACDDLPSLPIKVPAQVPHGSDECGCRLAGDTERALDRLRCVSNSLLVATDPAGLRVRDRRTPLRAVPCRFEPRRTPVYAHAAAT